MKFTLTRTSDWSQHRGEVELLTLEDFLAFVEENGKVVVMEPTTTEGWKIEIYDDWRE